MNELFSDILAVGGKSNSLGRADEVIQLVLADKNNLEQLYQCVFDTDPWVRMRAADSLEKICRFHPDWFLPYIDKMLAELSASTQPSVQWHLAQIYKQVALTPSQKLLAINWLKHLLATPQVDWIVASNTIDTLAQFGQDGSLDSMELIHLLQIQCQHKSKAVVKRANKLLVELTSSSVRR